MFQLKEHKTDVRTEVLAGITTFMTMAYILAVNPNILSETGMDKGGLFMATAIAAFIGTLLMSLLANYPFALAPGMGLNAYFVTVAAVYSWELALTAVFVEGLIFILLSVTKVREALFNAIPKSIKYGVSAGIGLFIAKIGFEATGTNAVLSKDYSVTTVTIFILAMIGILVTAILVSKKIKGGILLGILIVYGLGIVAEKMGFYIVDIDMKRFPLWVDFNNIISIPSGLDQTFFKFDFSNILSVDFIVVIFAFLFVDLFDTLGTLIGVSSKAGFLDKEGKLPRIKEALLADAIATTAGAVLGTSTTTTYIESAAGVAEGGKTGLTSLTTAVLFGVALLFSNVFLAIPAFATAPALIIVGFYMMDAFTKIPFSDYTEAIPAFLTAVIMPFTGSISEGIIFGVVSYTVIKVFTGKSKDVNVVMYILTAIFILKYVLDIVA